MRSTLLTILIAAAACDGASSNGPPARLIVGASDTLIVNSLRPVRIAARVLDAAGHVLPDSGVRYQWLAGAPIRLTMAGVATCTHPGDAVVGVSLGALTTRAVVRCRPVHEVRSMRMVNLLVGASAQQLPFEAVDSAGRPVTLLAGHVTVRDTGIARVQGTRITGRAPGSTSLDMHIGDRSAHASVHAYALVETLDSIQAGQHLAVPVRLRPGEARMWRLPAGRALYFITVIPVVDDQPKLRLDVAGANCSPGLDAHSLFCSGLQQAHVRVSYPSLPHPVEQLSAAVAVWRQDDP